MKTPKHLIISSIVIVITMCTVIYWSMHVFGKSRGILFSMLFYWFGLCWPLALYFQGWAKIRKNLSLSLNRHHSIAVVAIIAIALAGFHAFSNYPENASLKVIFLALLFAVINGTAEEVYWRGSYLTFAKRSVPIWTIGLVCFAAWHIAFILPNNLILPGNGYTLLIGAASAGCFGLGSFGKQNVSVGQFLLTFYLMLLHS